MRTHSALLLAAIAVFTPARQTGSGHDAARAVQQVYDRIRDLSADFVHTYEGGMLRKKVTEQGTLVAKKPGRMRWHYTHPEEKLFVSDGLKLYSYVPRDRQVIVSALPGGDRPASPILFLAGQGSLLRDFVVALDEAASSPDAYALKLAPRSAEPDYEFVVLVVDRRTFRVRSLSTTDRHGGRSTLSFTNIKENRGVPDSTFVFKIPRGVDVVTDAHEKP